MRTLECVKNMEWHVVIGTQHYVAQSVQYVAQWLIDGRITWNTYVYNPRVGRWAPAREIAEIRSAVSDARSQFGSRSPLLALVAAVGCGVALLLTMIVAVVTATAVARKGERAVTMNTHPDPATTTMEIAVSDIPPDATEPDYAAGYARGKSEGVDHAKSGAGMPIPFGMNWMADMQAQAVRPSNADAWKRGFKSGFVTGFKSIKHFDRDESKWEQLGWHNARPGVQLYDYGGEQEATIQRVEPSSGEIIVRYRSGEVEPKDLSAVSPFGGCAKSSRSRGCSPPN